MRKCNFFRFPFGVHLSSRWACINTLRVSLENLQFLGRCSSTYRECEEIVELMNHEIEVHGLFPVNIGISNRKLFGVFTKNFDFCVVFRSCSITSFDVLFTNKEQQIIRIDGFFLYLEQKMTYKNLRPLSVPL